MMNKDIKQVLLDNLDEYTKHHAEKYAKYLFDEMHSQMAKQISNGIQFDFGFIPTVIKGYKYSSYDEWKEKDCCGNSCGCDDVAIIDPFIHEDIDVDLDEEDIIMNEELQQPAPMIHERNPDTGEISSRKMRSEKWIISQYNRNRLADDQIKNINEINSDAGKE